MKNARKNIFLDLYNHFASTDYGKKLSSEIRFERYKPEYVSNDSWEELLGPDVNNLKHALEIYDISKKFFEVQPAIFSEEQRELAYLAAIVHDWGEAVVGDFTFDDRNDERKGEEKKILEKIGSKILKNFGDKHLLDKFYLFLEKIFYNTMTEEGKTFDAIERIGHMKTGLKAWTIGKRCDKKDINLALRLHWLAGNVLYNQIPTLLNAKEFYFYVGDYLEKNKKIISEAFENHRDEGFSFYVRSDQAKKRADFIAAREKWFSNI